VRGCSASTGSASTGPISTIPIIFASFCNDPDGFLAEALYEDEA